MVGVMLSVLAVLGVSAAILVHALKLDVRSSLFLFSGLTSPW